MKIEITTSQETGLTFAETPLEKLLLLVEGQPNNLYIRASASQLVALRSDGRVWVYEEGKSLPDQWRFLIAPVGSQILIKE